MPTLVTGGCGFVGGHILRELVLRGEPAVSFDLAPASPEIDDIINDIKVVKGDVTDLGDLLRAIKDHGVDRIVHLASLVTAASQNNPVAAYRLNVGGTLNVLEAARIMGLKRVVYASSLAVYGKTPAGESVPETAPLRPVSLYGATKVFGEELGAAYAKNYGVDFVALRFPAMWGPGQSRLLGKSLSAGSGRFVVIVEKPAQGLPVKVTGGSQGYELLYIKDARWLVVSAALAGKLPHSVFNAGCGSFVTLQEVAEMIKKYLPQAVIEIEPGEDYSLPLRGPHDIGRAREALGYEPRYKPAEAIRDYLQDLGVSV